MPRISVFFQKKQKLSRKGFLLMILICFQAIAIQTMLSQNKNSVSIHQGESLSLPKSSASITNQINRIVKSPTLQQTNLSSSSPILNPGNSIYRSKPLRAGGLEFIGPGATDFQVSENFTGWDSSAMNTQDTATNPDNHLDSISINTPAGWTPEAGWIDISGAQALDDWRNVDNTTAWGTATKRSSETFAEMAQEFNVSDGPANLTKVRLGLRIYDDNSNSRLPGGWVRILNSSSGQPDENAVLAEQYLNASWTGFDGLGQVPADTFAATLKEYTLNQSVTLKKDRPYFIMVNFTYGITGDEYWYWHTTDDSSTEDGGSIYYMFAHGDGWSSYGTRDMVCQILALPVDSSDANQARSYTAPLPLGMTYDTSVDNTDLGSFSFAMNHTSTSHTFTTNTSVSFTLSWRLNFTATTSPTVSSFFFAQNNTGTSWNLTLTTTAISVTYSVTNHTLNWSRLGGLSSDWQTITAFNDTDSSQYNSAQISYADNDPWAILNITQDTTSRAVRLTFQAPNYLDDCELQKADRTGPLPQAQANRSQTINVASYYATSPSNGWYNISAAFPNGTEAVIPNEYDLPVVADEALQNQSVVLDANWFLPNGTYNITVIYWNGTEAGLYSRPLTILSPTELAVADITNPLFKLETLNITVHFNDTANAPSEVGIATANLTATPSWGSRVDMTAGGTPGVYYANISTGTANVGPGTVEITAEKQYYRNFTSISPLVVPIEFRQRTIIENLTFSSDVDNALYHTDLFNITVDLQNASSGTPSGVVPNAKVIAYSDHTDVNDTEFNTFGNGTFWLEVNTTDLAITGTFWLNITFEQLYFEPQFDDTETFTIQPNPTSLSTWTHANETIVTAVYYHPTQNHSFFIQWEDSNHNDPVTATTVQSNSSKATLVDASTPGVHTFEFLPNATGLDTLNSIKITLSRAGYDSIIYLVIFDVQANPTIWNSFAPSNGTLVNFDQNITLWMIWNDSYHNELLAGASLSHDGGKQVSSIQEIAGNYSLVWHLNYTSRLPLPQTWSLNVTLALYGYTTLSLIFEISLQKSPTALNPQWPSGTTTIQLNYTDTYSFWVQWNDTDGKYDSDIFFLIYDFDGPSFSGNASVIFNSSLSSPTSGNHTFTFNEAGTTLPGFYITQIALGNVTHADAVYELHFVVLALPTKSPVVQIAFPNTAMVGTSITAQYYWEAQYTADALTSANVTVYWNNSAAANVQMDPVSAGTYTITIDTSEIDWALNYNLTLEFWKPGYANQSVTAFIDIDGQVVELALILPDTLFRGEGFVVEAYLYQNQSSSNKLLQSGGAPVPNEPIGFSIMVSFKNGTNSTFQDTIQTNAEGIATFALSNEETQDIDYLMAISADYDGSGTYRSSSYVVDAIDLPPTRSPVKEVPLVEELLEFVEENLTYIAIGSILLLALLALSGQRFRSYQRTKRKRQAIERSLQEIRTMRSVIVRHRDGIRLFSLNVFSSEEGRDDAIAGMSAAIAAFLQEVASGSIRAGDSATAASTEFVRMEQRGLHMLQRNDKYTVVIIISEGPLGRFTEKNLRKLQKTIEKEYASALEELYSSEQVPEDDLAAKVTKYLYIGLLGAIRLNPSQLKTQKKDLTAAERKIAREIRDIMTVIAGEQVFYLDSYTSHLQNRKIPRAISAQFLLKGYRTGIFESMSHEELLAHREQG
ncbi:MAG: hypothetical protein ACE5OZ_12190 [Candidatus Heimdallarchaeota archaeon]